MKCPFELPVKKEELNLREAVKLYGLKDAKGKVFPPNVNSCIYLKREADYIVQAINSHEKLVGATKALVEDRDILQQDEGIFACQCLAKAPDDIAEPPLCCYCLGKQALEEMEN